MNHMLAGRFRVLGALGEGSMGAVYHVVDTHHDEREAAVKVIKVAGEVTPDLHLRFKEEFRAMTRLRHPNTVEVYDFGQLDAAEHFLAMELVPGRELAELARGGRLPLAEVYRLLGQLLQALHFIHSRLYVHRDIKSQNVRVKPDGTLKLIDFGLMAQLGVPADGRLTGTPGTMAPEVVRGGVIGAPADLYAVGCLAYELLTGELPYTGGVREVLRAHCQAAIPSLRAKRPDAPERLEALVTRLLAKDPLARYHDAMAVLDDLAALAGTAVARESTAQKASYLHTGLLVGREAELAHLEAALADVGSGRGRAIFLDAPGGVGKSRLARELLTLAKLQDVIVLEGACLEKVVTPYKALSRALAPALALVAPEELDGLAPALAPLFPQLAAGAAAPFEPVRDRLRLHEAIATLLRLVARRAPVVLFLDDLHWANPATLAGFSYLLHALEHEPVLCLATLRGDEVPGSSPLWGPVAEGLAERVRLSPFDAGHVRRLVVAMLHEVDMSEAWARALYDATAGNAFFVTEVLRYLIEHGALVHREGAWHFPPAVDALALPPDVEAAVTRRLANLSSEARALANVASVLGRYQNRDMLRAIADLDEDTLFDRLDELVARQFMVKDGHRYVFPHDRVREALYAALPDAERRRLHQRCGEYLEGLGEHRREALVNKLAHHFARGEDKRKAFHYLRAAGTRAAAAGLGMLALRRWHRADELLAEIEVPERASVEEALWLDLASLGCNAWPEVAIAALDRLIPRLEAAHGAGPLSGAAHDRLWHAYGLLGSAHGFAGRPLEGLRIAQQTLARLPEEASAARGALLAVMVPNLFHAGRIDEAVATAACAAGVLGGLELEALPIPMQLASVGSASFQNAVAYQGRRPDDAVRDAALGLAERVHALAIANNIEHFHGIWAAWSGRTREAWEMVERAAARAKGQPDAFVAYIRARTLMQLGEHEEAHAAIERALLLPVEGQQDLARCLLSVLAGESLRVRGELDAADASLARVEAAAREAGEAVVLMRALLERARVSLERGDLGRAGEWLAEVRALAGDGPTRNPLHEVLARRELGEVALKAGRAREAIAELEAALALFEDPDQDNPLEQARTLEALGRARHADGLEQAALAAFQQAGDRFHRLGNRHGLHRVTVALERLARPKAEPGAELDAERRWAVARALQL